MNLVDRARVAAAGQGYAGAPTYLAAHCVDVDDYEMSRLEHGEEWAIGQLELVGKLLKDRQLAHFYDCDVRPVQPGVWIVVSKDVSRRVLARSVDVLAEEMLRVVREETEVSISFGISDIHECSESHIAISESIKAIELKLVADRGLIHRYTDTQANSSPIKARGIELEVGRRILGGHTDAALALLKRSVDQLARSGITPEELRRWSIATALHAIDLTSSRRLADGSVNWMDSLALDCEVLLEIADIRDRSHLLAWLERLLARTVEPKTPGQRSLHRVQAFIKDHYVDDLRLQTVARAVHLSPYYISHLFRRELDMTFVTYLTAIRMRQARYLLVHTELPVELIAGRVGYSTPERFRRAFKRVLGVTPREYRDRETSGTDNERRSRGISR